MLFRKFQIYDCILWIEKPKISIIWKTNYHRPKRSEICHLRVVILNIYAIMGYLWPCGVQLKVILGSFDALAIFRNLCLMIRDRTKLNGER